MLHQLRLGYTVRNGLIIVSTEEALANRAEVRVYRVPEGGAEDLAQLIPATIEPHSWRYTPVPAGLMGGSMPGGYGGAMAPGMSGAAGPHAMGGLAGGEGSGPMPGGAPGGAGMGGTGGFEEGGGVGSIRVFRGVLVVSQTPEVHQKIEKLLDDLEKVLPPQSRTPGTGMMSPHSAPGFGTTTPPGAGYPSSSGRTPNYPGSGGPPRYPGQSGSPRYPGAGAPGYPLQGDPAAPPAADEFVPPPDKPASGEPARGVPTSSGDGERVDTAPAAGGAPSGSSTTRELPRTPGKARN